MNPASPLQGHPPPRRNPADRGRTQIDVWVPGLAIANMVGPRPADAAGYLATSLALLWRRRAPLAVLALIVTVSSLQYLAVGASEGRGSFLPLLIAFYSLGRYAPLQR